MKSTPFPIKSTRSGGEVRAAASLSERVALPSIYPALTRLTETAIEALFSEAEVRVSARPMTKQEREAGAWMPHGLVDRESIEARSLTVSTKCPHCDVELVSHERGSIALVCPK